MEWGGDVWLKTIRILDIYVRNWTLTFDLAPLVWPSVLRDFQRHCRAPLPQSYECPIQNWRPRWGRGVGKKIPGRGQQKGNDSAERTQVGYCQDNLIGEGWGRELLQRGGHCYEGNGASVRRRRVLNRVGQR